MAAVAAGWLEHRAAIVGNSLRHSLQTQEKTCHRSFVQYTPHFPVFQGHVRSALFVPVVR